MIEKWILLFKYLMTFHSLIDVGKLFCEALCNARLRLQYFRTGNEDTKLFFIFQWPT